VLKSPVNWTKHVLARNSRYEETRIGASDACSFCLQGAINQTLYNLARVYGYTETMALQQEVTNRAMAEVNKRRWRTMWGFNDDPETSYEDVVKLCQDAGIW
jgi:hypothetical protein